MTKTCSKCGGAVEPAYEKYGRICRSCRSRAATERNRKNPERARAAGARYRAAHIIDRRNDVRRSNWRKQGIVFTVAEYDAMLAEQGGGCAVCGTDQAGGSSHATGTFHVDHDHATGQVRGLLCARCNRGVGLFEDKASLFRAAARYLDKHQPKLRLAAQE